MNIYTMKMEVSVTASVDGKFEMNWKKGYVVDEGVVLYSVR